MHQADKVKNIVLCGLFAALTIVATYIHIPIAPSSGGLIHLGSVILFVAAYILLPPYAAISVALGMTIFDLLSGWAAWAPFTFVIRFVQVMILSSLIHNKKKNYFVIIGAYILCSLWEMAGYYAAEAIIVGNWLVPIASMPSEILHDIIGIVFGLPLALLAQKAIKKAEI
jgi:uncharacterized membrane protein